MKHKRVITILIVAGLIVAVVLICGSIGYLNDPRRVSSALPGTITASPGSAGRVIRLDYCYSTAPGICVVSFGQDNADHALVVIKNDNSTVRQLRLTIKQAGSVQTSECQQVQFSDDLYYCTFTAQLQDGATVRIGVYSAADNHLIADGLLTVYLNATPTPQPVVSPTRRKPVTPTARGAATQTPTRIPTGQPTRLPTQVPPTEIQTSETPSYPD